MKQQLDKSRLRQAFSTASLSYDSVAQLQRQVGQALLADRDIGSWQGNILDIGCGTGFLTGELLARSSAELIALDIALPMLYTAKLKLAQAERVSYVCADAEALPFRSQCVSTVVSNLALQWCRRPEVVFSDIRRVLKPDGQLLFSSFGESTLCELKNAWATVDAYSHVNEFFSASRLVESLQRTGFGEISLTTQSYQRSYDSVLALMHELKRLGANNALVGRNRQLTSKSALQKMIAAYEAACAEGIMATYDVLIITAKR
ncbi:MAG: malonyl-ACP O-methyltransferase BioC [Methylovulum sp.]|jgi:malonyl-CoA O-methyltransferase|nr:malonyl-ACP O-methyltransferase BioC [Methylovulum sp.]MCF7999613.1 malonyl-ACP O-methyltransferase BioC [Methylovulum sp.]